MKNLKSKDLTDPQLCYLRYMYHRELFPGAEPMMSGKIIDQLVRNYADYFADYTVGELVEDFYILAQSWMIEVPLIKCNGNIGTSEDVERQWSGAASPCYTRAVLTEAGMKYVEGNEVMNLNFC